VHASASGAGGKRISQNEFTEKAWQAVVAAPDIAKQYQQQIVVRASFPRRDLQLATWTNTQHAQAPAMPGKIALSCRPCLL